MESKCQIIKEKNDKRKQSDKSKKSHKEVKILKDPTKLIPKRVNLLFFVIFVLFMILIGKLFNMQVLNSHFYAEKSISAGGDVQIIEGAPRGSIYDATGKALASTVAVQAVEFTRSQNATADEMYQVANKLATILSNNIDVADLTTRDKKRLFLG